MAIVFINNIFEYLKDKKRGLVFTKIVEDRKKETLI